MKLFMNIDYKHSSANGIGWTAEGSEFESRQGQVLSPLDVAQTGSGSHTVSYPMGTGSSFSGVNLSRRDHSPPTFAEVKNKWIYMFTPSYIFMA
jgi:hypothetical protein